MWVALRKESVDRNQVAVHLVGLSAVALRKESVDRNSIALASMRVSITVALRKESVDRNQVCIVTSRLLQQSLSARRAWIEILLLV